MLTRSAPEQRLLHSSAATKMLLEWKAADTRIKNCLLCNAGRPHSREECDRRRSLFVATGLSQANRRGLKRIERLAHELRTSLTETAAAHVYLRTARPDENPNLALETGRPSESWQRLVTDLQQLAQSACAAAEAPSTFRKPGAKDDRPVLSTLTPRRTGTPTGSPRRRGAFPGSAAASAARGRTWFLVREAKAPVPMPLGGSSCWVGLH
jgi:hypothetical protein